MQKTHFTKIFLFVLFFIVATFSIIYFVKTNVKKVVLNEKDEASIKIDKQQTKLEEEIVAKDGIKIISPEKNANVSHIYPIITETTGLTPVSKVEFFINKKLLSTDTKEPYNGIWDTTKETNGVKVVTVKSYDTNGELITENFVLVTVFNNEEAKVIKKNGLPPMPTLIN